MTVVVTCMELLSGGTCSRCFQRDWCRAGKARIAAGLGSQHEFTELDPPEAAEEEEWDDNRRDGEQSPPTLYLPVKSGESPHKGNAPDGVQHNARSGCPTGSGETEDAEAHPLKTASRTPG